MLIDGQIREKSAHGFRVQFARVSLTMEKNVALDPIAIGLFSAEAEATEPRDVSDLISSFRFVMSDEYYRKYGYYESKLRSSPATSWLA